MNAVEFLKTIWPSTGIYCISTPFPKGTGFKAKGFDNASAAAAYALSKCQHENVFYTPFSLKAYEDAVGQDGSTYKRLRRTHANMLAARCFYADIDCGPGKPYADQAEGLQALKAFCKATGFPRPMIVNSGRGLHVYWLLEEEIETEAWRFLALKIKAIQQHFNFNVDFAITADPSRVLRVIGTFNLKDPANPLKVTLIAEQAARIPLLIWEGLVEAAAENIPIPEIREVMQDDPSKRPTPLAVAQNCATFRRMTNEAATGTGVAWMNTNTIAMHTTGGAKFAHALARQHPTYSFAETQAKLDRIVAEKYGPTTCGKLEEMYGETSPCPGCPFYGHPKSSPVVFARRQSTNKLPDEIPQPQFPFFRTKRGIEFQAPSTAAAPMPPIVICGYDLFPTSIVDEAQAETKATTWTAVLPKRGQVEFKLPIDAYSNEDKLLSSLANRGVVLEKRHARKVGDYMSHYIKLLQAANEERKQAEAFGWSEDHKEFTWGNQVITADGFKPAILASGLSNVADQLHSAGTLEGQVEALKFYRDPGYVKQQFTLGVGLGSILFYMTGHFGLIINNAGLSGAAKTTTLHATGSFWGRSERFAMSAGETEATANGRAGRVRMLANLPVLLDEITLLHPDQLKAMVMSITQPQTAKIGHTRAGQEKKIPNTLKSTVMLCTSNNSAHAVLSMNNVAGDAGSMRVFENQNARLRIHTKTEADAFIRDIRTHYGHIGPALVRYVIQNLATVQAQMDALMAQIDRLGHISQEERYWAAAIAVAVLTLRIARQQGWLFYDPELVLTWAINEQLPYMRRIVKASYSEPVDVLQAYIDHITANTLVVNQMQESVGSRKLIWQPVRPPQGALKARLEVNNNLLYLSTQAFREYCDYRKIPYDLVVERLVQDKVLVRDKMKLSRFIPEYADTLGHALRIDLNHVQMAGVVPEIVVDNVVPLKGKGLTGE